MGDNSQNQRNTYILKEKNIIKKHSFNNMLFHKLFYIQINYHFIILAIIYNNCKLLHVSLIFLCTVYEIEAHLSLYHSIN